MSGAAGAQDGSFAIVPASPQGSLSGAPGGLRSLAGRLRIDVTGSPDGPVARWTGERGRTVTMPLDGSPDALHRVVVVTTARSTETALQAGRRLVFVDGRGRALATSTPLTTEGFDQLWPGDRLAPLTGMGVEVGTATVRDARALNHEFPGAARHWYLTTNPWDILLLVGAGFLVLAVAVVLIGLLG